MRKLYHNLRTLWALAAILIIYSPTSRAQNVQVLGNVKSITGNGAAVGPSAFVRFKLRNYTGSVPKVASTGVLLPTQQGCGVCTDVAPDASGNISGVNVFGNDQISPVNTFYTVEFWYNGRIIFSCDYPITGTQFNFNNAACLNTIPQLASGMIITQSFVFIQSPAATTWTINHNLHDTGVVFDFYDPNNKYIIPDTVTNVSPNQTVATFITPMAGSAVIIHAAQVAIATNQPNALLQNPPGNQTTLFDLSTTGSFTAPAFKSNAASPAQSGIFRLASGDSVCWRNAANNADLCLSKDGSDNLFFGVKQFAYLNFPQTWTATQTFAVPPAFTQATGTAPFTVSSTTVVANLNVSSLLGNTWAAPGPIGGTTPGSGAFTSVTGATFVASTSFLGPFFSTNSANPAGSGIFRCATADSCLVFRNNTNTADIVLGKNASDQPTFGGNIVPTINGAVTAGHNVIFSNSGQIADGGAATLITKTGKSLSVCTTGSSTYSFCNTTVTFDQGAFADTAYDVSCSGVGPSDGRAAIQGISLKTTTSVNVQVVTEGSLAITYNELDCVATHP